MCPSLQKCFNKKWNVPENWTSITTLMSNTLLGRVTQQHIWGGQKLGVWLGALGIVWKLDIFLECFVCFTNISASKVISRL